MKAASLALALLLTTVAEAIDFATLFQIPNSTESRLKAVILDDINGDQLADVAVATADNVFPSIGKLSFYDSFGELIYELSPPGEGSFARNIAKVSDRNNDGVSDLLVATGAFTTSRVLLSVS